MCFIRNSIHCFIYKRIRLWMVASSNQDQSRFNAGNENIGLSLDALEPHWLIFKLAFANMWQRNRST